MNGGNDINGKKGNGRDGERPSVVRCAIYTRKSTDENLDTDFNSLDAQREACELYIQSQAQEGWMVLPDRYDDGAYSGATMERPALERLIGDIDAGRIIRQQLDVDKRVIGFRTEASSLHYLTRFTEEFLPTETRTALRGETTGAIK